MAKQNILNDNTSWGSESTKIEANFTEVYENIDQLAGNLNMRLAYGGVLTTSTEIPEVGTLYVATNIGHYPIFNINIYTPSLVAYHDGNVSVAGFGIKDYLSLIGITEADDFSINDAEGNKSFSISKYGISQLVVDFYIQKYYAYINGINNDFDDGIFEIVDAAGNVGFSVDKFGYINGKNIRFSPLTTERIEPVITVSEVEEGVSRAFTGMTISNERIYVVYRYSTNGHNGYNGVIKGKHSDDFGLTWSEEYTIYDASEMESDYPEIWTNEPNTQTDARDPRIIITDDGNALLVVFVAFGYMDGDLVFGTRVKTEESKTIAIKISINEDKSLNLQSLTESVVSELDIFGGGITQKNGDVYVSTYYPVKLWKSSDYGLTWTNISTISTNGNEAALAFVNNILYCTIRPENQAEVVNGVLCYSHDNGLTWTETVSPIQLHGLSAVETLNGKMLLFGRRYSSSPLGTIIYLVSHTELDSEAIVLQNRGTGGADSGYGTVIRHQNYYYFAWYRADVYHLDAGIYFTRIPTHIIENMQLTGSNTKLIKGSSVLQEGATLLDVTNKINELINKLNNISL